jgi:tRNA threonylcarbamoyladenosine biosynthesis protein TsaE
VTGPLVFLTRSPEETRRLAAALARALEPLPRAGATVALFGDLGAGKTVFASGLARGLGVPDEVPVVSPTFTVARAYRGRVPVHHLDAYLVRSLAELEAAGFEDMGGAGGLTVVEWGDRIAEALPADRVEVTLTPEADDDSPDEAGPRNAQAAAPAPRGDGESGAFPDPPRRVTVVAHGPRSTAALARFAASVTTATPR